MKNVVRSLATGNRPAFLVIYLTSLLAGLWVFHTLTTRQPLPTTDLGQWLMYSREISGQLVPTYRIGHGIAPLVPAILAAVSYLTGDLVGTATLVCGICYFLLALWGMNTERVKLGITLLRIVGGWGARADLWALRPGDLLDGLL